MTYGHLVQKPASTQVSDKAAIARLSDVGGCSRQNESPPLVGTALVHYVAVCKPPPTGRSSTDSVPWSIASVCVSAIRVHCPLDPDEMEGSS